MKRRVSLALAVIVVGVAALGLATRQGGNDGALASPSADVVPGHYIVVLNEDVRSPAATASEMARHHGLGLRHVYQHALKGFAAIIPVGKLAAVEDDPRVAYVTPDHIDRIFPQELPSGIDRIEADKNPEADIDGVDVRIDVDIAIIDTGIDLDHPDLNVVQAVSFAGGDGNDKHGHGTHVAGTAAAKDNDIGVVGVAPGARLWAVQVCKPNALCFRSDIVAGIEYVTANADQIEAANISLGGTGFDDGNCGESNNDPEHQAICAAVQAGVVFAVAAGNEMDDAKNHVPAAYDEVLTVSAVADFDGKGGGADDQTVAFSSCTHEGDDVFACFSNFGADVDIAAPGVKILSTWNDGGTRSGSGTSMASPHVAGAVALYIAENPGVSTFGDQNTLSPAAQDVIDAGISQSDEYCGFTGDPDLSSSDWEPFLFVGGDGTCDWSDSVEPTATPTPTPTSEAEATATPTPTSEVEPTATPTPSGNGITLTATGYKVRGRHKADLEWSPYGTSASVDVYRNGSSITTTANDGFYTDNIDTRGPATYTYKVCEEGTTDKCSNESTVTF